MNTSKLTKSERLAIIRFCLNRGTRVKFSTHSLLRPFEMRYLENAFNEWDAENAERFEKHRQEIEDYKNGKPLSWFYIMHFGSKAKPSVKELEERLDKAMNDIFDIRKSYSLAVSYVYLSEEVLSFHNSMNPKITFGYSNQLHEECDSEITDTVCNRLLFSFKDSKGIEAFLTFGGFTVGKITDDESLLYYEDLIIFRGNKKLLSTITHENMFDIFFSDEDIKAFRPFEDNIERNDKIINKLQKD